jgi:hypothetical protein
MYTNGGGFLRPFHTTWHVYTTIEAFNVEVGLLLPSPNPLFLQPLVHFENQSNPSSKYNNKNFSSGSKLDLNLNQS